MELDLRWYHAECSLRCYISFQDVVKGNARLNLAFVANLFNTYPALKPTEEGLPDFDLGDFGETREEKRKLLKVKSLSFPSCLLSFSFTLCPLSLSPVTCHGMHLCHECHEQLCP